MQQPTLKNIHLRSIEDAQRILYAVHRGILTLISRRLDSAERQALGPGDAYVWEERRYQTDAVGVGMERWTEGRKWTPSRTKDDFFYYYERFSDGTEAPALEHQLIKQTYSRTINAPLPKGPYKIFITAYYSQDSLKYLHTISDFPQLHGVRVPEHLFVRERKTSRKLRSALSTSDGSSADTTVAAAASRRYSGGGSRTYAPYPAPSYVTVHDAAADFGHGMNTSPAAGASTSAYHAAPPSPPSSPHYGSRALCDYPFGGDAGSYVYHSAENPDFARRYEEDGSSCSGSGDESDEGVPFSLAPLSSLKRAAAYRRDPVDDRALRLLNPHPEFV